MIKTLTCNQGRAVNVSNVHMQPRRENSTEAQLERSKKTPHSLAPAVSPARQVNVPVVTCHPVSADNTENPGGTNVKRSSSVSGMLATVNAGGVIPVQPSKPVTSNILPTFNLSLNAGMMQDPRAAQGYVTTTAKFRPYESLTGISQERPEIIMLTNFQPLFNADAATVCPSFMGHLENCGMFNYITPAGWYFDSQFNCYGLSMFNMRDWLRALRTQWDFINTMMSTRTFTFQLALCALSVNATWLLNLVRLLESQKSQLDLRHDVYNINPTDVMTFYLDNYLSLFVTPFAQQMIEIIVEQTNLLLPKTYVCTDALAAVGYSYDSSNNVFASTKVWAQLILELKNIMKYHPLSLLDISPTPQQKDTNPTTILKPQFNYFQVSPTIVVPALKDVVFLTEDINQNDQVLVQNVNALTSAFTTLYVNANFANEEMRIVALASLLSKEYRNSYAFTWSEVRRVLIDFYKYDVAEAQNTDVFDAIFGSFGSNITDFPSSIDGSLASLAYSFDNAERPAGGVLNFETKYVEGDTGTLTPGGEYFFDRVLSEFNGGDTFDTSNVQEWDSRIKLAISNFSLMINAFNITMIPDQQPGVYSNWRVSQLGSLSTTSDLIYDFINKLIDVNSGETQHSFAVDRTSSVFTFARNNPRVKSELFMYVMYRIARYTNNAGDLVVAPNFNSGLNSAVQQPVVDILISMIISELIGTLPESMTLSQLISSGQDMGLNTNVLTVETLKHMFKSPAQNQTIQLLTNFIVEVLTLFHSSGGQFGVNPMFGNRTRYSGYLDTIVAMIAFDFAIAAIARYSNQTLIGTFRALAPGATSSLVSSNYVVFGIGQTSTNHKTSYEEVTQRALSEAYVTRLLTNAVLNTLNTLDSSLQGIINNLNSDVQSSLNFISDTLANNTEMIKLLFSEQQILLFASTVNGLLSAANTDPWGSAPTGATSYNSSNANQGNNAGLGSSELTILDESLVSPRLYQAMLGYFSTPEFTSNTGMNKRILTVGIPLGFTQRLKQKVNIREQKRASFQNKRNDIIKILVYKVDVQNPDIVYRPVSFLFEMSRFPTRYETSTWLPLLTLFPTINDIISAIPTQNYTQNPDMSTSIDISTGIEYASTEIAQSSGVPGARAAFDGPGYDFTTPDDRVQILRNHISSQMLEAYIKLMTGINVTEPSYFMIDPPQPVENDFIQTLTQHSIAHIADHVNIDSSQVGQASVKPAGGKVFSTTNGYNAPTINSTTKDRSLTSPLYSNPAGVAGSVSLGSQFRNVQSSNAAVKSVEQQQASVGDSETILNSLSGRHMPAVVNALQTISGFANTLSTMSAPEALNLRLLLPKQFDRVFNIAVDSSQFEIDVEKTMRTPMGKQALDLLIKHGDIVPCDVITGEYLTGVRESSEITITTNILERSFPQGRLPANINQFRFRNREKTEGDLIYDQYFTVITTYGEDEV